MNKDIHGATGGLIFNNSFTSNNDHWSGCIWKLPLFWVAVISTKGDENTTPNDDDGPLWHCANVLIRPYTGMNLSSSPPWILIVSSKKKKKVRLATNHFGITSNKIFYIYKTNKIKICKQDFLKTYKTRRSIIELRKHKADAAAGVSITVSRGTEAAVFELEVLGIQFRAKKDYVNLFTWRHSVPLRKYVSRKKLLV